MENKDPDKTTMVVMTIILVVVMLAAISRAQFPPEPPPPQTITEPNAFEPNDFDPKQADFNGDGTVDMLDFAIFAREWTGGSQLPVARPTRAELIETVKRLEDEITRAQQKDWQTRRAKDSKIGDLLARRPKRPITLEGITITIDKITVNPPPPTEVTWYDGLAKLVVENGKTTITIFPDPNGVR